ncbi:MAG: nuclear transport factor 2 family protein [Burkholderiales bacterium]|nr:nuclear transport factor 2 family protein [Burkholderiales bacterium]
MAMSRTQIDRLIDEHFKYEATDDLDGVMASLAAEVEHQVIPSPMGVLHDHAQIRAFYSMLFGDMRGTGVTPVRRLYGEDFVVDEAIWNGHIDDGRPFLCEGKRGPVSFRLLHVFEIRDGRIAREQVWCDLAAIQQQLGCAVG